METEQGANADAELITEERDSDSQEMDNLNAEQNKTETEHFNVHTEYQVIDEIGPEDSVSQVSSNRTSKSLKSVLLKAKAKKAKLLARASTLKKQQNLKIKQLELQNVQENLELEQEMAVAEAEEKVYEEYESKVGSIVSKHSRKSEKSDTKYYYRHDSDKQSLKGKSTPLNPHAPEWFASPYLHEQASDKSAFRPELTPFNQGHQTSLPVNLSFTGTNNLPTQTAVYENTTEDRIVGLQKQILDVMQLPKMELQTFNGDPLKYWTFIRSLEDNIHGTSVPDNVKLNRLFQVCSGKALEVIQCCALMSPTQGYTQARKLLKERFGNEYVIANAWIRKITERPDIKAYDGESLRLYADEVRSCMLTLQAMNRVAEVDNQPRMVKLVEKLPPYLQSSWRRMAVSTLKSRGKYPDITVLADFIETAAEEMNDPVFGVEYKPKPKAQLNATQTRNRGTNLNIQTTNQQSSVKSTKTDKGSLMCHFCSGDHGLCKCEKFKELVAEKRVDFVKEKKLCFNCFSPRHRSNDCDKDSRCSIRGCSWKHHRLLHVFKQNPVPVSQVNMQDCSEQQPQNAKVHSSACESSNQGTTRVALPIVPVKVRAPGSDKFINTCALLDSGSTNTFCSQALIRALNLKGIDTTLNLTTLTKDNSQHKTLLTSLEVADTDERTLLKIPHVFSTSNLPILKENLPSRDDLKTWPHLQDINFPAVDGNNVMLLIGQDVPAALAPIEMRGGASHEPYATRTSLGWTLNGPLQPGKINSVVSNFVYTSEGLQAQVEKFWKLETCESQTDTKLQLSVDDKKALDIWNNTSKIVDGHYQMDIPFKQNDPRLPNNFAVARSRLESLKKRLVRQPTLFHRYKLEIHNLISKGYAERVPETEILSAPDKTWYLPHHNVVNINKIEKTRIVFDCAAKYMGQSLNDHVLQGPDMTNTLIGVLLRFRENNIAVLGDIEAMFHQVKVTPKDRDVLRFLWWKDDDLQKEPEVFRMTVHLFGGVWSPSCASFALKRTASDNAYDFDTAVCKTVTDNFYVDDYLLSVGSVDEAVHIVKETCKILERGGFKLTKWISNSPQVIETIPPDHRAKKSDHDNVDLIPSTERALGVLWDTKHDVLGFHMKRKNRPETRRGLMSIVSSVYDPFGFACPIVLQAKKLLQNECKSGKDWDEPLAETNLIKWRAWLSELPKLENIKFDRCLVPPDFGTVVEHRLNHFSDASMEGYGTASYIRLINSEGKIHSTLVMGKARLAPIKQMTIPKLELSAAVLAVKVDILLRRELKMDLCDSVFWSDSMIVLHYIKGTSKRYQTFVANRIAQIHDGSRPDQWRYVEIDHNPADDASRGMKVKDLVACKRWKEGPSYLLRDESAWPPQPELPTNAPGTQEEVKGSANVCNTVQSSDILQGLISKFSSWFKTKKSVAWLMRFRTLLHQKAAGKSEFKWNTGALSVSELAAAETQIVKLVQRFSFGEEIDVLTNGGTVKKSSPLVQLEPSINTEGLICVGGRLKVAPISETAKHQVILPKFHPVTSQIIRHHHVLLGHSGKEHVLAVIRQKFWIVRARSAVNKVLRKCITCQRRRGKLGCQRMADLPLERVTPKKPPFAYTGIDCFGPFQVKRGRSTLKRYGCLFTCLTTRAVHIEKLESMDTDAFINAMIRFQCRRGRPEKIRSDNGTNFKGANREIQAAIRDWNQDRLNEHFLQSNVKWEFNPPAASHMGGVWERQIRTIKRLLETLLKDRCMGDEALTTVFCEAESIVNSRPLTAVSDNSKDFQPLTPNHLLIMRSGSELPYGKFTGTDGYRKRWRNVQMIADQFWNRWVKEYLPTLQLRQKWFKSERNLRKGDIVMVLTESCPRRSWPLARVTEVFPGKDGLVRSAKVQTRNRAILTRPVNKLCLLECYTE